jgi:hypothetical protein
VRNNSEHVPACMLSHHLLNKAAAIIGYCEVLKSDGHADPECLGGLQKISDIATAMAQILHEQPCTIEAANRFRGFNSEENNLLLPSRK